MLAQVHPAPAEVTVGEEIYECRVCAVLRAALLSRNTLATEPRHALTCDHRRRPTVRTRSLGSLVPKKCMLALVRRRLRGAGVRSGVGLALAAALVVVPETRGSTIAPAVTVIRDVAYGTDPKQRFDVY